MCHSPHETKAENIKIEIIVLLNLIKFIVNFMCNTKNLQNKF